MDKSGPRLADGWVERFPDLDAVFYRNWNWCADFRRIQSACISYLSGHLFGNRGSGHEYIKIQRGSSPAETCSNCSYGAVTKRPAKVFYPFQEADHSIF